MKVMENTESVRQNMSKVIKDLNPNKVHFPYNISPYVLKKCAETLNMPLDMLFKNKTEEGSEPREYTRANVLPIFDKGNRENKLNYGPLSLIRQSLRYWKT